MQSPTFMSYLEDMTMVKHDASLLLNLHLLTIMVTMNLGDLPPLWSPSKSLQPLTSPSTSPKPGLDPTLMSSLSTSLLEHTTTHDANEEARPITIFAEKELKFLQDQSAYGIYFVTVCGEAIRELALYGGATFKPKDLKEGANEEEKEKHEKSEAKRRKVLETRIENRDKRTLLAGVIQQLFVTHFASSPPPPPLPTPSQVHPPTRTHLSAPDPSHSTPPTTSTSPTPSPSLPPGVDTIMCNEFARSLMSLLKRHIHVHFFAKLRRYITVRVREVVPELLQFPVKFTLHIVNHIEKLVTLSPDSIQPAIEAFLTSQDRRLRDPRYKMKKFRPKPPPSAPASSSSSSSVIPDVPVRNQFAPLLSTSTNIDQATEDWTTDDEGAVDSDDDGDEDGDDVDDEDAGDGKAKGVGGSSDKQKKSSRLPNELRGKTIMLSPDELRSIFQAVTEERFYMPYFHHILKPNPPNGKGNKSSKSSPNGKGNKSSKSSTRQAKKGKTKATKKKKKKKPKNPLSLAYRLKAEFSAFIPMLNRILGKFEEMLKTNPSSHIQQQQQQQPQKFAQNGATTKGVRLFTLAPIFKLDKLHHLPINMSTLPSFFKALKGLTYGSKRDKFLLPPGTVPSSLSYWIDDPSPQIIGS
jgi:hypothetical protein